MKKAPTPPQLTRGERVIAFIERYCVVPEGKLVGQPLRLEPFQRKWILEVYDNPHGTRLAILSIARKNGKTPLVAALVLVHTVGPETRLNSQIISGAMSQEQAATVYKYAAKMVAMSPNLQRYIRLQPSLKRILGLPMNAEYRAVSRQRKTAHGMSPVLAILDELGQVRGEQDDFVEAIETSLGAYDDGMLMVISTQAASSGDLLSKWIDNYFENKDPHTVCHVYAASNPDCGVLDENAWREANPALGIFRSEQDLRDMANKAHVMPSFEPAFRNLMLNQRAETRSPLISRGVWIANSLPAEDAAFMSGAPVFGGLDLSARTDLTSFVMVCFYGTRWHVRAWFWTPAEGIHDRARVDAQPYPLWRDRGFIRATPGKSVDYDVVAPEIRDIAAGFPGINLVAVAFDRWRIDLFKKACERTGVDLPLVPFGQGFKDMSPAIDDLEEALLNDRLAHGNNPVLTMCAANSIAAKDEAGNRKLDKMRSTGRIDGISALTMAIGAAGKAEVPVDISAFLKDPLV